MTLETDVSAATGTAASSESDGAGLDREAVESFLRDLWCRVLRIAEAPDDARFFDLGGSSLQAVRMLVAVATEYGAEVDLDRFFSDPTLDVLADLVVERSSAPAP